MKRSIFMQAVAAALAVALASPVIAADAPKGGVELVVKSFQDVEVVGKDGKKTKKRVPATQVVPGSEVIYTISWINHGGKPAEKVVVNNRVPAQMNFVAGSSKAEGALDEVSVDGGKTWGALDSLKVKGADGVLRAATAADVTHVHWKLLAPIKPGGTGSVGYRAVLK